jgi:cell division protein FtsZ
VKEGLINLDFADVRSIMSEMGKAMMGTGEATGDRRAVQAAEAAISNPLLDEVSRKGARGLLISITGGNDLTLYEVDEAASRIRQEVDEEANIILGATFDSALDGVVRVSVVATGIDHATIANADPLPRTATRLTPQPIALQPAPLPIAAVASAPELIAAPAPVAEVQEIEIKDEEAAPVAALTEEAADEFIPPAPEPMVRGPRMPTIDELPPVVQPAVRQARGELPPAPAQPERRRSLLEKLAAFGITRPEDSTPRATAPLAPPRQLAQPAPMLGRAQAPRPAQGQLDAQGRQQPRIIGAEDDQLEIPAFLRRSNGA